MQVSLIPPSKYSDSIGIGDCSAIYIFTMHLDMGDEPLLIKLD